MLTVLVTPHGAVRPDQRARLLDVHPGVRIIMVDTLDELLARLPEADGIVTGFQVPDEHFANAPKLRWIHNMGAGVDRLLTGELMRLPHITISASKGPMGHLMAEHALALMLALARNLPGFQRNQSEKRWRYLMRENWHLTELGGKTIAILGVGEVGGHLARMCGVGLNMRVIGMARASRDVPHIDRYFNRDEMLSALGEADVVALSMPVTPSTIHIINAEALAAMKPTTFLVNVARGKLIDEVALVEALRTGQIAGAGLDVTDVEPLPDDSPLWDLPNAIVTPHASAVTDRLGDHFVDFWAENIRRFVDGRPLLGLVDREAGY